MSLTIDLTQQAFSQAMRTGTVHERNVNIVVVRLLAVALMVTSWRQPQSQTPLMWPLPDRYRAWPTVESGLESSAGRRRLQFYVSPEVAALSDDEPFPVGTVFVVETTAIEPAGERPVARFIMGKYAGVTTGRRDRQAYGAWAYAAYGPRGELLPVEGTACGICRLPLD
jgi:hypothetical protein